MKWFKRITPEFKRTVLVALFVGLVAGALGAIAAWSSLLSYQTGLLLERPTALVSDRVRAVASETEILNSLREETSLSLVDIYSVKSDPAARYFPTDSIGHGLVLSTDGWILSHVSVISPLKKSAIRVGVGPLLLPVDNIVEDMETGAVFIKVKAENLRAVVFDSSSESQSGDSVYAIENSHRLRSGRIDETHARVNANISSDLLTSRISLTEEFPGIFTGGPLINSRGAIIGILTKDSSGKVRQSIPSDALTPLFSGLFSEGKLIRPALGAHGIHLSGSRIFAGGRERGFLLTDGDRAGERAVTRGSAAEAAGLKVGDIITKIKDTLVNGNSDIAELLLDFKPQDKVELTVSRGGEDLVIPVTLGARDSGTSH